ncbi:MAG: hypothetical protein EOM17_08015 [Synergistales bacterium]|nr:hypothetical protein [Synergistales bacterium]
MEMTPLTECDFAVTDYRDWPAGEDKTGELKREIVKRWNRAPRAIELLHQVLSYSLCDVSGEMEAVLGEIEAFLTDIEAEERDALRK